MTAALILCWGLAAAAEVPADAAPKPPDWFRQITRVAYTDLPNRNRQGDWPDKLIADLAAMKVQLLFSRAHSGEAWDGLAWRGKHGPADPKMEGDGTRRVVELCRRHGLRYIAYYWAQREPKHLADEHPDWRCLNAAGKPTQYFCVNTPYRQLMLARAVELVELGVDGVFYDMFHARAGECYCRACVERFRRLTGQPPPRQEDFGSLTWQAWVDFKYRTLEGAVLEINRAVKRASPQAALVVNSWNAWVYRNPHNTRNSIRMAEVADGLLEEIGWYDTVDPSFFAFPTLHNYMCWHLAGLCKEKRAVMWSSPSWLRQRPLSNPEATIRTMTAMTGGCIPAQSVPGRAVARDYFQAIAERDEFFRGSRLTPWCGLLVSEPTELWYGREDPKNRYIKGVYGALQTALERHLPVSLLTERELTRGMEPYRVILAPNAAALADAELEALRRFVRDGGGLVCTHETGWFDEHGRPRAKWGLADLLPLVRTGELDNQRPMISMEPGRPGLVANLSIPRGDPWRADPVLRRTLELAGATQAEAYLSAVPLPCRILLVEGPKQPSSPAIHWAITEKGGAVRRGANAAVLRAKVGKGTIVYFPFDLTAAIFHYGEEHFARILELALREAASAPPPVEVAAPRIVQAAVYAQGPRTVVHLLNDVSSFGRSQNVAGESLYERREVIPLHGIEVTFRDRALKRFFLMPGRVALTPRGGDGGQTVSLPPLGIQAMVVAEP